jgi:hypothetical protein
MQATDNRSRFAAKFAMCVGSLVVCLLTSCALFAYGTGRLNPIRATLESAFTVSSGETNFVTLSVPALGVAKAMPAPLSVYPPENLVRPFERRTVSLPAARWQSSNAPSGWGWDSGQATLELRVWQRLGQVWENRAEVYSDLEADKATVSAILSVPSNAPLGSYSLSAVVGLATFSDLRLRIGVTVSPQGSSSSSISTQADGSVTVRPGATYLLVISVGGLELQRISDLASLAMSSSERPTDRARVRGDEWRVGNLNAPNRWELEWLEGNLGVEISPRVSSVGFRRLRTEYTVAYTDLQLLLGLRAVAAKPGVYNLVGQLEYRAAPAQPLRWAVTVK